MTDDLTHAADAEPVEPAAELADLTDAEQVELVEPTDNALAGDDEGIEQPPVAPAVVEEG